MGSAVSGIRVRSSIFRDKWVWEFFTGGFPYLGTGATGVPYFVMNGCGNFFTGRFPYLGTGVTGVPCFVMNGRGNFFTGGFPYLVNFKKELAIS